MIPPDVPEATIIGLASLSGPNVTDRSALMENPEKGEDGDAAAEHRVGEVEVRDQGEKDEIPHVAEERPVPGVSERPRQDQRAAGRLQPALLRQGYGGQA